jgi:putative mRNA 3-end processing factor
VEESGARRVLATHGSSEPLARYLRETRGLDAGTIATRLGETEGEE